MAYNTGNPLGSTDARDLADNAYNFDTAVNSPNGTWIDRLGVNRTTFEGAIQGLGFFNVGDFATGYTLTNSRQTLTYSGHEYGWTGTFPKVVVPGSTPTPEEAGAWVDRTDLTLRSELVGGGATIEDISLVPSEVDGIIHKSRDSDVYDIIVTYGQSNSAGEPILSGDVTGFPSPLERSLMYDFGDGTIKPIIQGMVSSSGVASSGHAWGEFANEWYRQGGHGSVVVHCGRGATSIAMLSKGYTTGAADYYGLLVSAVAAAKAQCAVQGLTVGKTIVLFHQGETDQLNGTTFETYRAALVQLVADLAVDIVQDWFGVFTVGCPVNRPEYRWAEVQNAQRYVAQGRTGVVLAFDGCPSYNEKDGMVGVEGTHYTQKGLNTMGYFAAVRMWEVVGGGITRKTSDDISRYHGQVGAPWMRAQQASAIIVNDGGVLTLRHRDNGSGDLRPTNVKGFSISADTLSLLINISDRADFWSNYSAWTRNAYGTTAEVTRVKIGDEYYLQVDFYIDITVGVKVDDGSLYFGLPLSAAPAWVSDMFSVSVASNVATITHLGAELNPVASLYPDASFTDSSGYVAIRSTSTTETKVKVIATTNPVAVIKFSRLRIKPESLQAISGFALLVHGTYAPEF